MIHYTIIGQQLVNGLILGSIYGLIAVGYTMVYGIIGMINFAHGDIYMISAYLSAISIALLSSFGIDHVITALLLTLIFSILITSLYSWVIEKVAYRPLRNTSRLSALISAIGVSLVLQNYIQLSQGSKHQGIPHLIQGVIRLGNEATYIQITNVQLLILIISFISMLGLTFFITKSKLGRAMRATQQDLIMANILGIPIDKIISSVFIIGSIMAAIAGLLVSLNYGSFDFYIGFITGIKAFTAAVLGGIGSLPGAMLGGLVLGMSESIFSGFINSDYKDVFAFSILIFILILRPYGLLGRPTIEKV